MRSATLSASVAPVPTPQNVNVNLPVIVLCFKISNPLRLILESLAAYGAGKHGALELRDVYAGKPLSQPSVGVRHLLHVRSTSTHSGRTCGEGASSALPQKRRLGDTSGASTTAANVVTLAAGDGTEAEPAPSALDSIVRSPSEQTQPPHSQLLLLERLALGVDPVGHTEPSRFPSQFLIQS